MEKLKPWLKLRETAKVTGLSMYYLRQGVRSGKIPHITSGTTVFINIERLLQELDAESLRGESNDVE